MSDRTVILKVQRVARDYFKGIYTMVEVCSVILDAVNAENATEILSSLPAEVLEGVGRWIDDYPRTEAEWESARFVRISGALPGSLADSQEPHVISRLQLRESVEAIRIFLHPEQ